MTLNEFIAELEALRAAGHGDCDMLGQIDHYGGSGSMDWEDTFSITVEKMVPVAWDAISMRLGGKDVIVIYP